MAKTFWIVSERLGSGDDGLGALLMRNFVYSLARAEVVPERIMLMNGGVRLACEGSSVVEELALLAERGVLVKVCGTCLDYLGLKDELAVGEIGDMQGSVGVLGGDADVVTVA